MSSVGIVRTGLAGLLLLSLVAPAPEGLAEVSDSAPSDVSGSAEGTADGGGVVTISVESSVTTAGSGGGDGSGGGVTSSSSSSTEVTVAPVCYYKPGDTGAEAVQGIGKVKTELDLEEKRASARGNKRAKEDHNKIKRQIDKNFPDYDLTRDSLVGFR